MFFMVILTHPDGPEWGAHADAHVQYLKQKIEQGKICASGPVTGRALRTGMYVACVPGREDVDRLIAEDPFAAAGIIQSAEVLEWWPFLGAFAAQVTDMPDMGADRAH